MLEYPRNQYGTSSQPHLPPEESHALSVFCSHALISPRCPQSPSACRFNWVRIQPCGFMLPVGSLMKNEERSGALLEM